MHCCKLFNQWTHSVTFSFSVFWIGFTYSYIARTPRNWNYTEWYDLVTGLHLSRISPSADTRDPMDLRPQSYTSCADIGTTICYGCKVPDGVTVSIAMNACVDTLPAMSLFSLRQACFSSGASHRFHSPRFSACSLHTSPWLCTPP